MVNIKILKVIQSNNVNGVDIWFVDKVLKRINNYKVRFLLSVRSRFSDKGYYFGFYSKYLIDTNKILKDFGIYEKMDFLKFVDGAEILYYPKKLKKEVLNLLFLGALKNRTIFDLRNYVKSFNFELSILKDEVANSMLRFYDSDDLNTFKVNDFYLIEYSRKKYILFDDCDEVYKFLSNFIYVDLYKLRNIFIPAREIRNRFKKDFIFRNEFEKIAIQSLKDIFKIEKIEDFPNEVKKIFLFSKMLYNLQI